MRRIVIVMVITVLGVLASAAMEARPAPEQAEAQKAVSTIPRSLQIEHEAIHGSLEKATQIPGPVGAAARELAAVLGPHFARENEIALPPLGLLAPLAAGKQPAGMTEALAMSNALRAELPRMLEEHTRIRAAAGKLRTVARKEKASAAEALADELMVHAQTEEEVLYPAAILVGDIIRARMMTK